MKLKLKKETVETAIACLSADANEELIENFRHDWLAMEAEIERLSKALARSGCWAPQDDDCERCPPCLERAKGEEKTCDDSD